MTQAAIEGGCACGEVRYVLDRAPMFVHCCHCRWCQRETGSAFVLNGLTESEAVTVTDGAIEVIATPSASGAGQRIVRCLRCRVALWSHYGAAGDAVSFVRLGTLDEPARFPPDIHIFTATKLPWVILPEGTPSVPAFYRYREYWPAPALARLRQATGR